MKYLPYKVTEAVEGKHTGPLGGKGIARGKCISWWMMSLSDGHVYVEVYAANPGLTAGAGRLRFSGRLERIWLLSFPHLLPWEGTIIA